MDRQRQLQLLKELLPFQLAFGCIGANRPVRQLYQGDNRDSDLCVASSGRDSTQHLTGVLPLALGGNQHARIEDQSHAGGRSGSRWLSTAASTSLAKSGSMVALESSGS